MRARPSVRAESNNAAVVLLRPAAHRLLIPTSYRNTTGYINHFVNNAPNQPYVALSGLTDHLLDETNNSIAHATKNLGDHS